MTIHQRVGAQVWCGLADNLVNLFNEGYRTVCGGCGGVLKIEKAVISHAHSVEKR